MGRAARQHNFGGSGKASWRLLLPSDSIEGNEPSGDSGGMLAAATTWRNDGYLSVVYATHITIVNGFRTTPGWRIPVWGLYPDFDPLADILDVCIAYDGFPHGLVEVGLYAALVDSDIVDASLAGGGIGVRTSGAATDQASLLTATGSTPTNNVGIVDELYGTFQLTFNGTDYPLQIATRALLEATTLPDEFSGTTVSGTVASSGTLRGATLADWQLRLGPFHGSIDDAVGAAIGGRIYVRRRPATSLRVPELGLPAKKTSGTLVAFGVGDSILDGVGQDGTFLNEGTTPAALYFGGRSLPAGVRMWDDGVEVFTWQDSAGAGPDAGYWPHIAETALALGFGAVELYRWGVSGNTTATIKNNRYDEALRYALSNQKFPDFWLLAAGTNDSQVGEGAAFRTAAVQLVRDIERVGPRPRLVWAEPVVVQQVGFDEADSRRTEIQTLVAARPSRRSIAGAGVPTTGTNHPSLQGYRDQGRLIVPAYLAAG